MFRKETDPNDILFYYNRDTLFNDVSLMSNFMAKNLKSKDGNSLTDDFAMSDDERDVFDACVRQTLPDIYEAMSKITNGISPAFDDDADGIVPRGSFIAPSSPIPTTPPYYDSSSERSTSFPFRTYNGSTKIYLAANPSTGASAGKVYYARGDKYVTFTLQDNEAYNDNILYLVDASLNNALKLGTLKEYYSIVVHADFLRVCGERFVAELFKLKNRLFQLKKKSVESNLT